VPPGPITAHPETVIRLLTEAWGHLSGSTDTSMEAYARDGGPADLEWNPPILSFTIERHGGTVLGSTRAEKQRWSVDVVQRAATHGLTPGARKARFPARSPEGIRRHLRDRRV
jgi:hypothetical protein